ncbi:hypothetical protein P9B05_01450 [Bacillus velezensis]|nr:hypothetical protein [Bacillus velezensis]MEC0928169.1 hypothetical protein [Bacillus velezensis]
MSISSELNSQSLGILKGDYIMPPISGIPAPLRFLLAYQRQRLQLLRTLQLQMQRFEELNV